MNRAALERLRKRMKDEIKWGVGIPTAEDIQLLMDALLEDEQEQVHD